MDEAQKVILSEFELLAFQKVLEDQRRAEVTLNKSAAQIQNICHLLITSKALDPEDFERVDTSTIHRGYVTLHRKPQPSPPKEEKPATSDPSSPPPPPPASSAAFDVDTEDWLKKLDEEVARQEPKTPST